jgi:exodeoxyribonuclease VII large subunit
MSQVPERNVYTVTRLNREVRTLLERGLAVIWLEGELSNFTQPASGHWYFTLKDKEAQIRGALFRQRNVTLGFTPKSGQLVLVRGRVSLYEPRGDYQMIVDHMEPAGVGALQREFARLKERLAAEGLFEPQLKRPLPAFPRAASASSPPPAAPRFAMYCTSSSAAIPRRRC